MKREKKVIKHRVLDRNTVLGIILLAIFAYLMVAFVLGTVVGAIIGIAAVFAGIEEFETVIYVGCVLASFLMLAIHKRWFYPEFDGCLKFDKRLGRWMLNALLVFVILSVPGIVSMLISKADFAMVSVKSMLVALVAGVSEEIAFRGVPGSYAMRQINEAKKITMPLIITSLLFALVHGVNLFMGATVQATVFQMLVAFAGGCVFFALFLRSGSVLPPMMVHFLYDVCALTNADLVSESGIIQGNLSTRDIVDNLILVAVEIGVTLFLLRKSVWGDIMDVWEKKWNKKEKESVQVSEAKAS
ncbi:MAG: CPBP family intramembrane metalloprotease [Butyrivibrio sp.]|nr:CPBP family intramembrane metalloprotease [Butyrivibrio sp.]